MKVFFDTEFVEHSDPVLGHMVITPLSIGVVREDGEWFYAETLRCLRWRNMIANKIPLHSYLNWHVSNTFPHMVGGQFVMDDANIARRIENFINDGKKEVGERVEWWGWYPSYDWVVLSHFFGAMLNMPESWGKRPNDIKALDRVDPKTGKATPEIKAAFIKAREFTQGQWAKRTAKSDEMKSMSAPHNALFDAFVQQEYYNILNGNVVYASWDRSGE
jgi:hypothetical protein